MFSKNLSRLLLLILFACLCKPLLAQTDIAGEWSSRRGFEDGVEEPIGDYTGLPINDAARMRGDSWYSWSPSLLATPEHQCVPHGADRIDNFSNMRIWKEIEL